MKCALCDKQAAAGCANPQGRLCRNHGCDCGRHRNKVGALRGSHSEIARVTKINGRLDMKTLQHAPKYGSRQGKYAAETKCTWQAEVLAWFAALPNLDFVADDWLVRSGPCQGMLTSEAVQCYKKFSLLRRKLAATRGTYGATLWEAWAGKRRLWERHDDERWGVGTPHFEPFWGTEEPLGPTRDQGFIDVQDTSSVTSSLESSVVDWIAGSHSDTEQQTWQDWSADWRWANYAESAGQETSCPGGSAPESLE